MIQIFWRYRNLSGIRTFSSVELAAEWADNMLVHLPTMTIERA